MSHCPSDAIAATLDHGLAMYRNGRLQEAATAYKAVLSHAPNHPEALHMLGAVAYNLSRFDEACQLMEEADRHHPASPWHHLCNFAIALVAADRDQEAVTVSQRALAIDSKSHRVHGRMGQALQKMGRIEEALRCYVTALRLHPAYGDGYFFLGSAFQALGHTEEADIAYHEALRIGPESSTICTLLGNAFNRAGLNHEATTAYRVALAKVRHSETQAGPCRRASNILLRRLCAPLSGRILSIGSGNDSDKEGNLYREYFPYSDGYFRIDYDSHNHPDIVGDIQNLREEVADHACDVVSSLWVLEHVQDTHAALAEIHRILRPGGAFVFALPLNREFHSFPHDYHRFTQEGIRELFHGMFHIEEIYPIGVDEPFTLDPRLSLFGVKTETAPADYVGRCRKI